MGRWRKITRMGGSWYIKLEPADVKDFELKENQEIDVSDMPIKTSKEKK